MGGGVHKGAPIASEGTKVQRIRCCSRRPASTSCLLRVTCRPSSPRCQEHIAVMEDPAS